MFSAILILLALPFTDLSRSRGIQFRPLSKIAFFIFAGNFLVLMQLGAKHVESPFIEFGQISTVIYFSYFLIIMPLISLFENSLQEFIGISNDHVKAYDQDILRAAYLSWPPVYQELYLNYSGKTRIINKRDGSKEISNTTRLISNLKIAVAAAISSVSVFYISINKLVLSDAPRPWGIYFQDSATPQMEGLVELHDNILFYLVIILFSVGWFLWSLVRSFLNNKSAITNKYVGHGTLIELIWTISPAIILILIAFPSFKLLYLMDEVTDPSLAILAEGHQWYWSYQYPDFLNSDHEFIEFDSYLVPESDLQDGALRMLEVDNRVILPELTHVRFVVTGGDVIHSYACPALGIKCDAYPGRLNQASVLMNRKGSFYGQRPK